MVKKLQHKKQGSDKNKETSTIPAKESPKANSDMMHEENTKEEAICALCGFTLQNDGSLTFEEVFTLILRHVRIRHGGTKRMDRIKIVN